MSDSGHKIPKLRYLKFRSFEEWLAAVLTMLAKSIFAPSPGTHALLALIATSLPESISESVSSTLLPDMIRAAMLEQQGKTVGEILGVLTESEVTLGDLISSGSEEVN